MTDRGIDRQTAIAKLKDIRDNQTGEDEYAHIDADEILLRLIDDEEVTARYREIKKWYS
ncbi:MAG TPA: hypothetical protein VGO47_14730 [Chlamydiales bacterium]|jgi:hypothetical protein|nr:hypothetical protein [Chlamydiales bacterium]